jgi:hypothetical protein
LATKKATAGKTARKAKAVKPPPDLREPRKPAASAFRATLEELREALAHLTPPAEPHTGDLVLAMVHFTFADGLPCAVGQEAYRRLDTGFVDRNELRLSEAFEIEAMLQDLEIPNLFERSLAVRDSVAQIYNDQNAADLSVLREAMVTERNQFFARAPAIKPRVAKFLDDLVSFESILFSDRSTLRVQQRLGLDSKSLPVDEFIGDLKPLLRDFGHLPLAVPPASPGSPGVGPGLCPACIVTRLGPPSRRRSG